MNQEEIFYQQLQNSIDQITNDPLLWQEELEYRREWQISPAEDLNIAEAMAAVERDKVKNEEMFKGL